MASPTFRSGGSVPIPPTARKVFEGKVFTVFQWEQIDANGKTHFYEKARKKDGVAVIPVLPNGQILLINETKGGRAFASLPTGGVDENEDPLIAAQRELMEETRHQSSDWTLWFSLEKDSRVDSLSHVYVARNCQLVDQQPLGIKGEIISLNPVDFPAFLEIASQEDFRNSYLTPHILRARLESTALERLQSLLFSPSTIS